MTPLIQAPIVIPQLILSLCTVSIATCNKLFENMTLFNGDHKDTKIIGTINGKNFYWKIDTGSAVTCMNINAFETAFGKTKEKNMKECKTDICIRNRKCTHTVKIADESSENILGIDFFKNSGYNWTPRHKRSAFNQHPPRHYSLQGISQYLYLQLRWFKPEPSRTQTVSCTTSPTSVLRNNP